MKFNRNFLRELQEKLRDSESYQMTKLSVQILLTSPKLYERDKKIIFHAIHNDYHRNGDPLSLRGLWNEKQLIQNMMF